VRSSRFERPVTGGFTLIELLLVLVIFSLSIGLVAPHVSSGIDGVSIKASAKKMATALNSARVQSARDRQNYYVRLIEKEVLIEPSRGEGRRIRLSLPEGVKIEPVGGAVVALEPTNQTRPTMRSFTPALICASSAPVASGRIERAMRSAAESWSAGRAHR